MSDNVAGFTFVLYSAMDDVIETLVVYHCSVCLILFPCCIHEQHTTIPKAAYMLCMFLMFPFIL